MCGIAGIFSKNGNGPDVIQSMTQAIRHRGPDAQALYRSTDGTIALGHNRLSIIDLSAQANQPMVSSDGRYRIVFNGEIYNFRSIRKELLRLDPSIRFFTESDTEIILLAFSQWGPSMVEKLEGMFAMALVDESTRTLHLFRDRMGKKPLFYFIESDIFIFASEIKSLLKHPVVQSKKSVNFRSLQTFLHLGYIPEPDTILNSIHKFPAANRGIVGPDMKLHCEPYWDVRIREVTNTDSLADGAPLKKALEAAVEKRMISDVPLGTFLSGGTDSALITAITTRLKASKVSTFNIGFDDGRFDESGYARAVAKVLNTDHHEYRVRDQEASSLLETYVHHFDEPFADTSAIPTMLVSGLAKKEVTVALTGDGGDELFLGYGAYDWANRLDSTSFRVLQPVLRNVFRTWGNSRLKRISYLLEEVPPALRRSHIFSQEHYYFSQREISSGLLPGNVFPPFNYLDDNGIGLTPAEKQAIFDLRYYLKDDLLVKVDRSSMFHALECRCPFLDQEVVRLALQLPPHLKNRRGERKWILKQWLKEFLPDELIFRPKQGFSVPLSRWLKGDLNYLIHDYLNDRVIIETGIFSKDHVHELLARFNAGEDYLFNRLWVIIVVTKWIRENG